MTSPLARLSHAGVSVRLDSIGRDRLINGRLSRLVSSHQVRGATTNPDVIARAIESSDRYDREIAELALTGVGSEDALRSLTACDARFACDVLRTAHEATDGADGRVSIEADPRLAHDAGRLLAEARVLWQLVNRPNLLVQIPATTPGLRAATACLAEGIGVDLTVVFSPDRYAHVLDACLTGLEQAAGNGLSPARIAALASFQLAPVDTEMNKRLDALRTSRAHRLRGTVALAAARLAYQLYERTLTDPRWRALRSAGARPPRLAWTATTVEDAAFEDTRYVEALVAPDTVSTVSEATLYAVADHGLIAADSVHGTYPAAREVFDELDAVCVDYAAATASLERGSLGAAVARWSALTELVDAAMNGEVARLGPSSTAHTLSGTGESSV